MQPIDRTLKSNPSLPTPVGNLTGMLPAGLAITTPAGTRRTMAGLSLRKNIAWAFASNVLFAACQWGSLVVLAKLADAATVGRFALALAITGPIFLLTNLQLRGVQTTDAHDSYEFGHYLALRIVGSVVGLTSLVPVIAWSGYSRELAGVILAVGLGKALEAVTDIFCGQMQRNERLDRAAFGRITAGIGSLLGLGIVAAIGGNLVWASLGWAAGHGVALVLGPIWAGTNSGDLEAGRRATQSWSWTGLAPIWDFPVLWRLTMLALPLGVVMMLVSLYHNLPRYFIENQLDEVALGVFAALAYLMVAGHMVLLAAGQAVTPRFARLFAAGELRSFVALLLKMTLLAAFVGVAGVVAAWLLGDWVLEVLYTKEYAGQGWLLLVLASVAAIQYVASPLGEAMTAMRRFRSQVPLLLAVTGSTALAATWLVPQFGLIGAALSSGVGALVQLGSYAGFVVWTIRSKLRGTL